MQEGGGGGGGGRAVVSPTGVLAWRVLWDSGWQCGCTVGNRNDQLLYFTRTHSFPPSPKPHNGMP